MKKLLSFLFLMILCLAGCHSPLQKQKNEMLEVYGNDENYITLTGEVIEVESLDARDKIVVKSDDIKEHFPAEDSECEYLIFADTPLDIAVGEVITYTTVKVRFDGKDWLPIVGLSKNDEMLLESEDGKENLLAWVNQLQYK